MYIDIYFKWKSDANDLDTELYWVLASQLCLNGLRYIF